MKKTFLISYGLIFLFLVIITLRESIEAAKFVMLQNSVKYFVIAIAGFIISTTLPIIISLLIWLSVDKMKVRWLVHVLTLLMLKIVFEGGQYMFILGLGSAGDSTPEGIALLTGGMICLLAIIVHAIAFFVEAFIAMKRRVRQVR
ncbi:hypothetical protein [Rhizorhabdus sp. FW153]|uniref:hypothetical protein n=1 Tax=Rhizorhabdus sp. FW153 TaxID=3400216 RepID=UPI003CF731E3